MTRLERLLSIAAMFRMKTIYCDESGFTGYNLLDPAQPVFAIASACIEEGEAEVTLPLNEYPI